MFFLSTQNLGMGGRLGNQLLHLMALQCLSFETNTPFILPNISNLQISQLLPSIQQYCIPKFGNQINLDCQDMLAVSKQSIINNIIQIKNNQNTDTTYCNLEGWLTTSEFHTPIDKQQLLFADLKSYYDTTPKYTVGIHLRFGDAVQARGITWAHVMPSYYEAALDLCQPKFTIAVITDDIILAKNFLKKSKYFDQFVFLGQSWKTDFITLLHCQTQIIDTSTFSGSSAVLGNIIFGYTKTVICPTTVFGPKYRQSWVSPTFDAERLLYDDKWIRLSNQ